MGKAWKAFEQEVADFFGGTRRVRINYSESIGDIIHPNYSIECKYGGQVPLYLCPKAIVRLTSGGTKYWVVPSDKLYSQICQFSPLGEFVINRYKRVILFLDRAMNQARRYNPTLKSVVCVKKKNQRGFNCIWEAT